MTVLALFLLVVVVALTPRWAFGAVGPADHRPVPVTAEAMRWRAPPGWLRQAFCIHRHESVDWHRAYVDWRGRPSLYSGGMQFLLDTWRRAGGTGHAWQWAPREQVYRAFVIWDKQDGVLGNRRGDWSEWGTAGKCGLR